MDGKALTADEFEIAVLIAFERSVAEPHPWFHGRCGRLGGSVTWPETNGASIDSVKVEGTKPDTQLVVRFHVSDSDRQFGARLRLWPSPFLGEDVVWTTEDAATNAGEALVWLEEAIHTWLPLDAKGDADGVVWIAS